MTTTPIASWSVDIAEVTAIYPWVGSEGFLVLVSVVLWLAWHVWQVRHESNDYDQQIKNHGDDETIKNATGDEL